MTHILRQSQRTGSLALMAGILVATLITNSTLAFAKGSRVYTSSALNNEGISSDAATSAGNFDGSGNSYSQNALAGYGFFSATTAPVIGITFPWPKVASGTFDNWVSAGQVLPLASPTSGTQLGILGAASNGQSSGTATVTYTDSSTQTFTLTFSDWTLHAGTVQPAASNTEVAKMSYRNTKTGHQTVTTYLFYTSVAVSPSKTVQSLTLPGSVSGGKLHVFSFGVLTPAANSDWGMYLGNAARTGFNSAESSITPASVSSLARKWTTTGTNGITGQPVVVGGQIYWGSWDGVLHDTPASGGADVWHIHLGVTSDNSCVPPVAGITNTVAYGSVSGTPTIFAAGGGNDSVGGKNVYMYAVNAATGAILWKTVIGSSPHDFAWSSPVLYNGSIYYGISSFGDCPLVRGRVVKLDQTTGAIQNTFYTTNSGCTGNGVTSSPAIDTSTGKMYFATGNPGTCAGQSGDYAESVVELNASNLSFVASWEVPKSQQIADSDFLATPTIFTAHINGALTTMVGAVNKNAIYYAFNASKIASGPVWEDRLGPGSECPQCGGAGIAPSAFDGRVLYLGGPAGTINGTACNGSLQAVNPATGAYLWRDCLGSSSLGAVMATPGVLFLNHGRKVSAYNAGTGALLFTYFDMSSSSNFWGTPSVANGWLYDGNMDGTFFAFH
jgi:outer membrane protein assembly factor BamB